MMSPHTEKSTWLIFAILCLSHLTGASEEATMETLTSTTTETVNATTLVAVTAAPTITTTTSTPKTNATKDLQASETADPKKIDIVKQIRRLNEDGSYTVGYEAGDGTFKIESRDVLGNIKGTFGYVDNDGEIKRVSYSTSNSSVSPPILPVVQATRLLINRTRDGSTTRRPQPTIIYPKTSSNPTRPTVIQAIPRRRPTATDKQNPLVTTTESYRVVTGNFLNLNSSDASNANKNTKQFPIFTPRGSHSMRPVPIENNAPITEPKIYRRIPAVVNDTAQVTTPSYLRTTIIYDKVPVERIKEGPKPLRANTFRRQLSPTHYENEQNSNVYVFQQPARDDTTDVYGGSIAVSTPRPLFTTSTGRPRLVPIHTVISNRQKLNEKFTTNPPQVHEDQQESTLEATTNKIDGGNYVTSNPVPLLRIPVPQENLEQRVIERPFIKHTPGIPVTQFRTREFLRDNPGAPIPIGNQRVLFRYNPNYQVDENGQFVRQVFPQQIPQQDILPVSNHINSPQEINQQEKPNIIAIPVHGANIPPGRYQIFNPYTTGREDIPPNVPPPPPPPPNIPPPQNEYRQIAAPVSTKDLRRLLHQLLVRQNRIQAIMDIREDFPNQPFQNQQYNPQPLFEPDYGQKSGYGPRSVYPQQYQQDPRAYGFTRPPNFNQNNYQTYQPPPPPYPNQQNQFPNRNDYRAQDDGYRNEITNFDPSLPYESQRYIPRRRFYRPRFDPRYEEVSSTPDPEEQEFLPPDVREALLLKMLMLAIHPDFTPTPMEQQIAMTTPAPDFRKKVRNVQILGEEEAVKEDAAKRNERLMKLQSGI